MQHHFIHPLSSQQPAHEAGITEVPGWKTPTRIIILTTTDGVRQWRCEGLASNVTPEALTLLDNLWQEAEKRLRRPASETSASPIQVMA